MAAHRMDTVKQITAPIINKDMVSPHMQVRAGKGMHSMLMDSKAMVAIMAIEVNWEGYGWGVCYSSAVPEIMTQLEVATFGAGCFWGVEKSFKRKFGSKLRTAQVGYAGGNAANPTYRQVCTGQTGHAEVLQVEYDPSELDYPTLIDFFYRSHDPTTKNRQGNDAGTQYRSAIFYHNDQQKEIAEQVTEKVRPYFGKAGIATTIEPVGKFYPAEDYHQAYLEKNPHGYECATHFERTWDRIQNMYNSSL
ncbi:Peptide-methionine (S)-S-oxide reductase [Borealophlyctis nickersoniae]|nr:Peptide-methionine (S)-S-oxide reductase [Borealophlyctis nickersoniae]